jgi:hypothetical protein
MNTELRTLLIDSAKNDKPITYGKVLQLLHLDNNNAEHRRILSTELANVSRYEHSKNRPMLSSMAMYEGLQEFGNGIYDLADELGYGEAKKLEQDLYAFQLQKDCIDFWNTNENFNLYNSVVKVGTIDDANEIPFFTKGELDFFFEWQYKAYEKDNEIHIAAKNFLLNTVWTKTAYWAKELKKRIKNYDIINIKMWSQPGWDDGVNGKIRVARFKPYTWARVFKEDDDEKDIFFTIGINAENKSLVYKLDYFFEEGSTLSLDQKSLCKQLIPEELKWISIPYDQVENYDWEKLLQVSSKFINDNTHIYETIIAAVWKNEVPKDILRDKLILRTKPINGIDKLPEINPSFNGIEKDYLAEHQERILIGTAGEELVIAYEKSYLKSKGKIELAERVDKMKDGVGYDILSFFEDGTEKHIEVKTTIGNIDKPFDISLNEWMFMRKHPNGYFIYRLFNYSEKENIAEFYILDNPKEQLLFQSTKFKAFIKK